LITARARLIDAFQALDAFACLVPPPLVDLRLRHASLVSDLEDLLAGPHELAVL